MSVKIELVEKHVWALVVKKPDGSELEIVLDRNSLRSLSDELRDAYHSYGRQPFEVIEPKKERKA